MLLCFIFLSNIDKYSAKFNNFLNFFPEYLWRKYHFMIYHKNIIFFLQCFRIVQWVVERCEVNDRSKQIQNKQQMLYLFIIITNPILLKNYTKNMIQVPKQKKNLGSAKELFNLNIKGHLKKIYLTYQHCKRDVNL